MIRPVLWCSSASSFNTASPNLAFSKAEVLFEAVNPRNCEPTRKATMDASGGFHTSNHCATTVGVRHIIHRKVVMSISLQALAGQVNPEHTVLLFGAGASIPSGAPSVAMLTKKLAAISGVNAASFSFSELCSIFELKKGRKELVSEVRKSFAGIRPTGGLLNISDFDWFSIFTTNYDDLVEKAYLKSGRPVRTYSSNFDFGDNPQPSATNLFKIHGTIGYDISDGHRSRLILTSDDYDVVEEYREALYDRLKNDINSSDLLIVGQSLADPDLSDLVKRALKIRQQSHSSRNIFLLLYQADEDRAMLFESRGIKVSFGGIDDFFFELKKRSPETRVVEKSSEGILPADSVLNGVTLEIAHQSTSAPPDFSRMFSGGAPNYADIRGGLTFQRTARSVVVGELSADVQFSMLLGASGVGKTTIARQIALDLVEHGFEGWEHMPDRVFLADEWRKVAVRLQEAGRDGVLVLDDAHLFLAEVNRLVDGLSIDGSTKLRLILTSSKNHWKPRVKSANLFKRGNVRELSSLDNNEIGYLLAYIESSSEIRKLVDRSFKGFTQQERRRRLEERCNRDFFVCLKNIFASESFDTIVLREFAGIAHDYQGIYKYICALESFGVRVHRQLIIRLLNITAQDIPLVLSNLDGLVDEYEIDRRESVYGWRGRHVVISEIIARHKFNDQAETFLLLKRVVKNISPTYDIEIRTIRQLCSFEGGLPRISSVSDQNEILRMMISVAPRERVPRHRLIANLIRHGDFTNAETEIRVFENDLGADGPVRRYKVRLLIERAISTTGLMPEDKASMLNDAYAASSRIVEREPLSRQCLQLHADVCLELFRVTGDYVFVDEALEKMKSAERELADPDITKAISRFEQRITPFSFSVPDMEVLEIELE